MRDYKANTFQMNNSIFQFGLTPIQFVVYSNCSYRDFIVSARRTISSADADSLSDMRYSNISPSSSGIGKS